MELQSKNIFTVIGEDNEDDIDFDAPNLNSSEKPKITQGETPVKKILEAGDKGEHYVFKNKWVLWTHDIDASDWTIKSYQQVCSISNLSDFWKIFNNFDKLNYQGYHFFLMREGIQPIWEDKANRNGGVCSFKVDLLNSLNVWLDMCTNSVNEVVTKNQDDINGISFSPKNNWVLIKLWNKDAKNDLSKTLVPEFLQKYSKLSIKYKANAPEY